MTSTVAKNLDAIAKSYGERVEEHGSTAVAAGWRDLETQNLRFEQLHKIIGADEEFTLIDLGCGYGAFAQTMPSELKNWMSRYDGYDISDKMIEVAKENFKDQDQYRFFCASEIGDKADYVVASGIFNHHFEAEPGAWLEHITKTIEHMYERAEKGVAFNIMTSYVDFQEDYIYYQDPMEMLKICLDRFGKNVSLHHDYNLFEFTVLITKG